MCLGMHPGTRDNIAKYRDWLGIGIGIGIGFWVVSIPDCDPDSDAENH